MIDPLIGHHVFPIGDLKPHDFDVNGKCWCKPSDEGGIWVHFSMDRREDYENGRKLH